MTTVNQCPIQKRQRLYPFAALLATLLVPQVSSAIGFLLPNQDPAAIARGNAFAATADNPSAIYYNPAGITQITGWEVQVGELNYLGIHSHYQPAGGGPDVNSEFEVTPVPQIYAVYSPTNLPLSFGLGVYAPFGLGIEWPANSSLRTLDIEARMQFLTVNPVVAWKILPSLSIAAGPAFNYSTLKFQRGLFSPVDEYTFDGHDYSIGGTLGIRWQPCDKLAFGVDYRSESTMNYTGRSSYRPGNGMVLNVPTTTSTALPQELSWGISYRPTAHWNVESDVEWDNTHRTGVLTLDGTSALFGSNLPFQLNWHDTWMYKFGVTRYFGDGWFVSAGYFFTTSTTSEQNFTPAIPDTQLHTGSLGFGRDGEHWHWAVAGQIIAGPDRSIATTTGNNNPFTGASPAGKYSLFIPSLSISVGYKF